jgi:hypothetical protein
VCVCVLCVCGLIIGFHFILGGSYEEKWKRENFA